MIVSSGLMPKGFLAKCSDMVNIEYMYDAFRNRWQEEFNIITDSDSWKNCFNFVMKLFCNVNIKNNIYKLYAMWHYILLYIMIKKNLWRTHQKIQGIRKGFLPQIFLLKYYSDPKAESGEKKTQLVQFMGVLTYSPYVS